VLLGGAAALGTTTLGATTIGAGISAADRPGAGRAKLADPFTLGVASGDPSPDGMVLWTRLAQNPLAGNGRGGMPEVPIEVRWELAEDERFRRIVKRGTATASPSLGHSVHVEPAGLRPGAEYFYRFRVDGHVSPAGRTRTAPAPGTTGGALTMCFASCSNYGAGYFTAYRRLAEDEPDLVLHLGDYQYEYAAQDGDVREVAGPETVTLANYRLRHAQYKTDEDLRLAHATAPWLVVWDDHETENNWADETPEESSQTPRKAFLARRRAAFQAYYENMPLRASAKPSGADMQLYRRLSWGGLVTFHLLDTRQYRSDQACGDDVRVNCAQRLDEGRSLTGDEQERWLRGGLSKSKARWDVLGQQVFFSQLDLTPGKEEGFNMDAWDGYRPNRDRIASALGGVRNGVVLTGDVHRHWAAEIKSRFGDPAADGVGTELVTTSITSDGDGDDDPNEKVLAENPHVKFHKNRRGYIRTRFTAGELRADYRILPKVTVPGAEASTAAGFVVTDRDPTLHRL
jgi:alkaline phosphatase D